MSRVYRDMESGARDSQDGSRLVYVLTQIAKLLELTEIERRLVALEGHTQKSALEGVISPERGPLVCIVFGDDDAENVIAKLRVARSWPNDGVRVRRVLRHQPPSAAINAE